MTKTKALVLCSGGVDSTTLLARAVSKYGAENVYALSISYGQKHVREIEAARTVAAYYGVPSVLLTGDKTLCEQSQPLHPKLLTVAVKDDFGGHNQGLSTKLACKKIREAAEAACKQELSGAKITLPDHFAVQITFKDHCKAVRSSYYPGAQLVNPTTIAFESDDWYEVCRMLMFVIL